MSEVVDLGEFIYDTEDSDVVLELSDDFGEPYPFTGATSIKLVCQPLGGGSSTELTGSIYDAAAGRILFEDVAQGLAQPGQMGAQVYRCFAKWLKSGASKTSRSRTEYRLTMKNFPS